MSPLRTRIAPTPSGFLHVGNGTAFALTYAMARAFDGKIVLRIDDLDAERMRPEYVEDIFQTLDWLGIEWDEGAISPDDFYQNFSQHKRLDGYFDALKLLQNQSDLYACTCTRKEILELSPTGLYPNMCRFKNLDFEKKETAWRLLMPENTEITFKNEQNQGQIIHLGETMGDFVVRQKNGLPAYQIASLVDDLEMGINFIVRGNDLLSSTAAQIYLSQKINRTEFGGTLFLHHVLLQGTDGQKLSKSQGASSLKEWRKTGRKPTELFKKAAFWLDLPTNDVENMTDLISAIKINLAPPQ